MTASLSRTPLFLSAASAAVLIASPAMAEDCSVEAGTSQALLIEATILTPERAILNGEVLIDAAGTISCVGPECGKSDPDATRITCPNAVLSPGFINVHEHLAYGNIAPSPDAGWRYTHRHDWRKGLNGFASAETFAPATDPDLIAWMELRHLLAGETAMVGGAMAPGLMRNLDFEEGLEGLDTPRVTYAVFPLDDVSGTERYADCNYGPLAATRGQVSALHSYVMHLAEGVGEAARNEFRCASDPAYDTTPDATGGGIAHDIMLGNVTIQHGVGLTPAMLETIADDRISIVWSPRSNLALYGKTLDIEAARKDGINLAMGTDWLPSGSFTMGREAECARDYMAGQGLALPDRELWMMMTANGAKAVQMEDRLGRIAVGYAADLVLVDAGENDASPYAAVIDAPFSRISLILRGGHALAGDDAIMAAVGTGGCDTVDAAVRAKRICLSEQGSPGYAALKAKADAARLWPAWFDAKPPIEPACKIAETTPLADRPNAGAASGS